MAIVAGGIVSLKPVGGIVTNAPTVVGGAMTPEQLQQLQNQKKQQQQAQVDALVDKIAQQNQTQKRWSVPFK